MDIYILFAEKCKAQTNANIFRFKTFIILWCTFCKNCVYI